MPNSITNRQMFFILFLTLTSFTIVTIPKGHGTKRRNGKLDNHHCRTSVLFAMAAAVLVSLNNMFQGKVLFDYSRELVGRAGPIFWLFIMRSTSLPYLFT